MIIDAAWPGVTGADVVLLEGIQPSAVSGNGTSSVTVYVDGLETNAAAYLFHANFIAGYVGSRDNS